MDETYKLTQAHFRVFTNKVNEWAIALGLVDWRIRIDIVEASTFLAQCMADQENRVATIEIAKEWNIQPSEELIDETAFHEVCELLLFPIRNKLWEQCSVEVADEMIHVVIRRLEHLVIRRHRKTEIAKLK